MKTKIFNSIEELRSASRHPERLDTNVSGWAVGMHVSHCAKVMATICRELTESSTESPTRDRTAFESVVFQREWLPRGKAQSAKAVIPETGRTPKQLVCSLNEAESAIIAAGNLDSRNSFSHPVFGALTRDDALHFIYIHNRHHLKIIRDITETA